MSTTKASFLPVLNGDVLMGLALGLGVWMVKSVYSFLKIQETACKPVKKLGDDQAITVWGFQGLNEYHTGLGLADGSPYVCRVECYLKLIKQPYVKQVSVDLSENPRTKLPFANVKGRMVDDSSKILVAIDKELGIDALKGLSDQQCATALLIRRMLTGSLYWVRFAMNFLTETGRSAVHQELARTTPAPVLAVVYPMVVTSSVANMHGQGTARMPMADIVEQGQEDLRTLNQLVQQSKTQYILGTKQPTVVDTDVYAFVSHLLNDTTPSQMDWIVNIKEELPLLVQYIDRMRILLFPELSKEKTN